MHFVLVETHPVALLVKARRLAGSLAAMAIFCISSAFAQTYPSKPITVVWPSVAGSSTDTILRALGAEVGKRLGQTVIIENRAGANGTLGLSAMLKGKPDGYVLNIAPHAVLIQLPLVDPNFRIEVEKDFVPIVFLLEFPLVIAANPGVAFRDVKGLIGYAKANPGKLNFAVQQGTVSHYFAELFRQTAGIELTLVPYKSSAASLPDLVGGQIDLAISNVTVKPMVDAGKLIAIAVSSKERWAPFPNLPTLMESGLPMLDTSWYILVSGAGTPRDITERLRLAFSESLKLPTIEKMFADAGLIGHPNMSPQEITERLRAERRIWEPVIRKAGIKLQ